MIKDFVSDAMSELPRIRFQTSQGQCAQAMFCLIRLMFPPFAAPNAPSGLPR